MEHRSSLHPYLTYDAIMVGLASGRSELAGGWSASVIFMLFVDQAATLEGVRPPSLGRSLAGMLVQVDPVIAS